MKKALLILLTVMALNAAGQNHLVGVKGGVNFTNITFKHHSDTDFRIGATVGATYEYRFKNRLSVGADLMYDQRGYEMIMGFIMIDESGNEHYLNSFTYRSYSDYVSLPLKFGFNFGNKFHGFINIGLIPSLLINAKVIRPLFDDDFNVLEEEHEYDASEGTRKFDIAGFAEIGAGYKFCGRYWIFASLAFQHSFISYNAFGKWYHNGMSANIGVKYALKR